MKISVFILMIIIAFSANGTINNSIIYEDEEVKISFLNTEYQELRNKYFIINIEVDIISKGKMVQVINNRSVDYKNEQGGISSFISPEGLIIEDRYSNNLGVSSISPAYLSYSNKALPNEK
jgi:hypothetical protein